MIGHFTTLHQEATQKNPYLLLIQIVSCFLIKRISEYIKLDEYEGNPIIGRDVFILENGIKEKEI